MLPNIVHDMSNIAFGVITPSYIFNCCFTPDQLSQQLLESYFHEAAQAY